MSWNKKNRVKITNIYVGNLDPSFTDQRLYTLGLKYLFRYIITYCGLLSFFIILLFVSIILFRYGRISSAKVIIEKNSNLCKGILKNISGFGFIDYVDENSARKAIKELGKLGYISEKAQKQEKDETNLYFSKIPVNFDTQDLKDMLKRRGNVLSARILHDENGISKGVGLVRMSSASECAKVIEEFNGRIIKDGESPIIVKFADKNKAKINISNYGPIVYPLSHPIHYYNEFYQFYLPQSPIIENTPQPIGSSLTKSKSLDDRNQAYFGCYCYNCLPYYYYMDPYNNSFDG